MIQRLQKYNDDILASKKKERIGLEKYNNQGSLMKIIEYYGCHDIVVEFQDEWKYQTHAQLTQFNDGRIKNPYFPTVFGVGIIGEINHMEDNKKTTKEFQTWYEMIRRCYSKDFKEISPTYQDVTCCEEWLYFPNFYEWLHKQENYNVWKGQKLSCLDKDILIKGNKIYSPEVCLLVPHCVNTLFTKREKERGDCPIGVCQNKNKGNFSVSVSRVKNGKYRYKSFGNYPTKEEAFYLGYKPAKENHIKEIAEEEYLRGTITKQCYDAMMNYEVEITD
jgi:hypothetical protein